MMHIYLILIAYLLGSIPFGYLLIKFSGNGDIRKSGSGGTGATNVNRVGGIKMALSVWVLDMAKAALAVLVGIHFTGSLVFGAICGLVAIIGHCFPIWLGFRGGKGISCFFGMLIVVAPQYFVLLGVLWVLVALLSGYSSLGAIVSLCVLPFLGFYQGFYLGLVFLAVSLLCLYQHRANISRLLAGSESKINWSKKLAKKSSKKSSKKTPKKSPKKK